jgi:hypothetical protein
MELLDFYKKVEEEHTLEGVGIFPATNPDLDEVVIRDKKTGMQISFLATTILKYPWELLLDVIRVKRDPILLWHMSRVVGYLSRIENWNPSKIGELNDRRKGDYGIVSPKDEGSGVAAPNGDLHPNQHDKCAGEQVQDRPGGLECSCGEHP